MTDGIIQKEFNAFRQGLINKYGIEINPLYLRLTEALEQQLIEKIKKELANSDTTYDQYKSLKDILIGDNQE